MDKQCRKCGAIKDREDGFYRQRDTADGFTNYCRSCLTSARLVLAQQDPHDNQKRNLRRLRQERREQRADYQRLYRWRKQKQGASNV